MAQGKVTLNLLANFFGKGWMALMSLVFVPLYVKLLGIESFGLIGFYNSLVALFYLFDFGMGEAFCRETARLTASKQMGEVGNLLRTLEVLYWLLGILLAVLFLSMAPLLSQKWFQTNDSFTAERLSYLLTLMGISFFFQWPFTFYCKGFLGLQEHVLHNIILFATSSLRYIGAASLLYFIEPKLEFFFFWQIFSTCFQTLIAMYFLWKKIGLFRTSRFSLLFLKKIWKFSCGMMGIYLTAIILMQGDKLLISKLFSLEELGYYCLAFSIAFSLYYFSQPLINVYYPLYIQCIEKKKELLLKELYHKSCQLTMILVAPIACLLIFFSKSILSLWISDPSIVQHSAPLLSILSIGALFNCCMHSPYFLQLAYGWTNLTFYQNLISIFLLVPFFLFLSKSFGIIGASFLHVILNGGYILFILPLLHKRILPEEKSKWYLEDLLAPLFAATSISFFSILLFKKINLMFLLMIYLLITAGVILSSNRHRGVFKWLKSQQ